MLDRSDIFVYPSIWEEAFGISVVEAMARGCVPIVSNKGGLPEVVDYNKNYLFNDEIELEKELKYTINNSKKIDIMRIIDNAKKFKIENTIKQLSFEYKKLLEERIV